MDLKGKILSANLAFQKLFNYPAERLSSLSLKKITHPDDYPEDGKLFEEITSGRRKDFVTEKRYITKDGNIFHGRVSFSLTDDLKNKNNRILAIIEDVTGLDHPERNMFAGNYFLNALLENSPDQIYFKDLNSRFLKLSTTLAKKHNLQVEDLIGRTDFEIFGQEHAGDAYKDEQEIIRTGIPIIGKEEKENWSDDRVTWVSTSKLPLYNEKKQLIGTFGISRDITIKKRTEQRHEALFQISETVFTAPDMQSLFKKIHDVVEMLMPAKNLFIALYDEKERALTFPYYVDQYGKRDELSKLKKGMTQYVLHSGKATLINKKRFLELNESGEIEIIGTLPEVWLGIPLKLSGQTIGVMAVQDYENPKAYGESEMQLVTFIAEQIAQVIERKKNADEITRYAEELKQLNATKDKFFSIIAHDLRNPFITIMGFSDLLLSDYAELPDNERLFYVKEMKESAELSHNLLQNLLQWSRSQTGRIEYNPVKLELQKTVNENYLLLNKAAEKKQLILRHEIPQGLTVIADEEMLNIVLRNLLTNAIKFTSCNGIISVSATSNENFVEICVSDSGVGMNQKVIDNLFRLDATHSTTGTENEAGTGLGLILCKEFIEKHKGRIGVESEVGKGSKFIFTLPL